MRQAWEQEPKEAYKKLDAFSVTTTYGVVLKKPLLSLMKNISTIRINFGNIKRSRSVFIAKIDLNAEIQLWCYIPKVSPLLYQTVVRHYISENAQALSFSYATTFFIRMGNGHSANVLFINVISRRCHFPDIFTPGYYNRCTQIFWLLVWESLRQMVIYSWVDDMLTLTMRGTRRFIGKRYTLRFLIIGSIDFSTKIKKREYFHASSGFYNCEQHELWFATCVRNNLGIG